MTTRTVTGNVKTLTDSSVSSGAVTFEKVVTSTTGNTIHQFGTTTATTDGSGDFSIALAVPASGSYRYRMILPNGDAFYFSIADGASVNVATDTSAGETIISFMLGNDRAVYVIIENYLINPKDQAKQCVWQRNVLDILRQAGCNVLNIETTELLESKGKSLIQVMDEIKGNHIPKTDQKNQFILELN